MKKIMSFMLMIGFATILQAQQETLISGNVESGGFGGPVFKVGSVYDVTALFVGGRGGWIINHQFVLGGGGYGLVSEIASKELLNYEISNNDIGGPAINITLKFGNF